MFSLLPGFEVQFCVIRPTLQFRSLRTVLRSALSTLRNTHRVKRSADDVVPYAWEILNPTSPNQYEGVLLQVVTLTWNIARHLNTVCQSNPRHLTERRVRLLWRLCKHADTHATLLRALLKSRTLRLANYPLPPVPN